MSTAATCPICREPLAPDGRQCASCGTYVDAVSDLPEAAGRNIGQTRLPLRSPGSGRRRTLLQLGAAALVVAFGAAAIGSAFIVGGPRGVSVTPPGAASGSADEVQMSLAGATSMPGSTAATLAVDTAVVSAPAATIAGATAVASAAAKKSAPAATAACPQPTPSRTPKPPTILLPNAMTRPRAGNTAIVLKNGLVLLAGGQDSVSQPLITASAELYNPVTRTFTATGSMSNPRIGNTATLLRDGRVLYVGGYTGGGYLADADLYDPASGTFTPAGSVPGPYFNEGTATLLNDGRVLLAGGTGATSAAYLYDPSSGQFTSTGSLNVGRGNHTATLLRDGRVLIVGGSDWGANQALASAEIYDPATGQFSLTGAMNVGRASASVTLLRNGRVLVAGGTEGGYEGPGIASAELFDPTAGVFTPTGSMAEGRFWDVVALLRDGKVLFAGGRDGPGAVGGVELYNPASGNFSHLGSLQVARMMPAGALLPDGSVLIAGGGNSTGLLDSAELYRP